MYKEPSISYYQQEHIEEKVQKVRSFKEIRSGFYGIDPKKTLIFPHIRFVDIFHIVSEFINQKCYDADEKWHSLGVNGKPDIE